MSINSVHLTGNLTRDPELRVTAGGSAILNFGIAVNERRKNGQTGEWEDYAHFMDCVIFGKRAESLAKYLTKGTKVAIEGSINYSSWEDKNGGGRRSKLEIKVKDLEFLSSSKGKAEAAPDISEVVPAGSYVTEVTVPESAYSDDDIDF